MEYFRQVVQGTLEQALGEDQGTSGEDISDGGNKPINDTPTTEMSISDSHGQGDTDVAALREKLKEVEYQNQLINTEFAKLLREKEEELNLLRSGTSDHGQTSGNEEEILKLKDQLKQKETELKELNLKGETKFNKLKAQAKSKISALQEELHKLKEEKSLDVSANTSQESLNLSIRSIDESEITKLQDQLAAVTNDLNEREGDIVELGRLLKTRDATIDGMRLELVKKEEKLKDNNSQLLRSKTEIKEKNEELEKMRTEVCRVQQQVSDHREQVSDLQEQVSDLTHKLTISEKLVEEQATSLNQRTSEIDQLNRTIQTQSEALEQDSALRIQLEKEREEKAMLSQQLLEAVHRQQDDEKHMTRDLSFASSEFQIVSQGGDSEDDWKLIRTSESGSGSSEGKESSPPPEILSIHAREDSPLTKTTHVSPLHTDKLKASITELEGTITDKDMEIKELKDHVTELSNKLSLMEGKVTSMEEELQSKQWEETSWGDGFEETSEQLRDTIDRLENQVKEIHEQKEKVDEALQTKSDKLSEALQEKEDQIKMKSELEETLATCKSENTEKDARIRELGSTIDGLQRELDAERSVIGRLENEKVSLQSRQDQLSIELAEKTKSNDSQVEEVQNKLTSTLEEITKLQANVTRKEAEMKGMANTKDGLVKEIERLREENSDLQQTLEGTKHQMETRYQEYNGTVDSLRKEKESMVTKLDEEKQITQTTKRELEKCSSELQALEELQQREKTERENMREELKRMSASNQTFSSDSAKCREELLEMEREVNRLKKERNMLSSEVESLRETNKKLEKNVHEGKRKGIEVDEELKKYKQETTRLKEQFDSAVNLVQQENAQLKSNLASSKSESSHHASAREALQEQVKSEGRRSMELKEVNKGLHQEISTFNERCLRLEKDKSGLEHRLLQLSREYEQVQISLETSINDKESLAEENESTRRNNDMYEKHVLELTNQITLLVREKDVADENVRSLQREASVRDRELSELKEKMELLQQDASGQSEWISERQGLLDAQSQLKLELVMAKQEREEKEREIDSTKKAMDDLQTQYKILQDALVNARGAMTESSKMETSRITELEKRITDINASHNIEVNRLKTSLEQEQNSRVTIESKLNEIQKDSHYHQEHRTDFTIEMEESGGSGWSRDEEGGANETDNLTAIKKWMKRFLKNPNIVLVRLVRATPQTQFIFIGYLVLIHILLLVMFVK